MFRTLLPILLAAMGTGGGVVAGAMVRPAPEKAATLSECAPSPPSDTKRAGIAVKDTRAQPAIPEYIKLSNQFVVPVVEQDRVAAMVVLSLSIEAAPGARETIYTREPKLRDVFLQVLFDHANIGGFRGAFTSAANMGSLRDALLDAAQGVIGHDVSDILITDIGRQDV
ncbi:flagellar basal body-associated FliL family protein [Lutimaribacter sp. EGI FJ00015]|uniref:Flagellar basal body-associated FliL family protein n=1 Tax=Lutimaribacter degradans TaxID=2945989 RepID=A0ACC5ZUD2_9RHOB|nr:flagellar basal body-associated FliL family protein [Lutimaribacter sp. EGI FJ00013]MCM2561902.1 flagellar basal body-associated FliL family protein [Lutimaribacter sp. EGI FJ00013]MCO0613066.1 flagellar basal body-associated FliL family protein [Lutimaribacter sp. EGI FJ00015]MCO0635734.1 flagellar basal body-associated FliL family protein [Lutimaribacter sp. EGI FJ00014]